MAMESAVGGLIGEEWDALCKLMFTNEDAHLLMQLQDADHHLLPNYHSSNFFPIINDDIGCTFDVLEYLNFNNLPQQNSIITDQTPPQYSSHGDRGGMQDQEMLISSISPRQDHLLPDNIPHSGAINQQLLKRKLDSPHEIIIPLKKPPLLSTNGKKSAKVQSKPKTSTMKTSKSKSKSKSKGKELVVSNLHEEEEKNGDEISTSNYYLSLEEEEDSNASQPSINGSQTKLVDAKSRATRGSATDPQSLYARRRRERINERLRILQNLIPNGTKVDISTMLEDAVQYVKFLQVQIKLLSSDELWMYAPIIHNGVDVGMYNKIFQTL